MQHGGALCCIGEVPVFEAAQATISAAQAAVAGGNEKMATQNGEMAEMQLNLADAKSSEKETAEQVALSRAEVKKLEAQLDRFAQGEEK